MRQNTATTCKAIRIATGIYLALALGCLIGGFFNSEFYAGATFLIAIALGCYIFWTPIAYELDGVKLTVVFRVGHGSFPNVTKFSLLNEPLPKTTLRLCGDGGVFAGSGIFWNRRYGVFHAYVTRDKYTDMVLVETKRRRIIISPEAPSEFVRRAEQYNPGQSRQPADKLMILED